MNSHFNIQREKDLTELYNEVKAQYDFTKIEEGIAQKYEEKLTRWKEDFENETRMAYDEKLQIEITAEFKEAIRPAVINEIKNE